MSTKLPNQNHHPIFEALRRMGDYLSGTSRVDNERNPLSALNRKREEAKNAPAQRRTDRRNEAYGKQMDAAYKSDKVKGTPLK